MKIVLGEFEYAEMTDNYFPERIQQKIRAFDIVAIVVYEEGRKVSRVDL